MTMTPEFVKGSLMEPMTDTRISHNLHIWQTN